MSKKVTTLGYLGYRFQTEFINQILHPANKKFADRVIDIVHAKYFDNEYFRLIIATIKDYFETLVLLLENLCCVLEELLFFLFPKEKKDFK